MADPDGVSTESRRELVELDRGDCLRLLSKGVVGRVIFTRYALPTAHPVNYLLDNEEIVFQTGEGGALALATRNAVIGFEVDDIDYRNRTGWSVVGVGRAYEVTDPDRLADLTNRMPEPWAPGRTAHVIALPLQQLTGRYLRVAESGDRSSGTATPP